MKNVFLIPALVVLLSAATVTFLAIRSKVDEEEYDEEDADNVDDEIVVENKD